MQEQEIILKIAAKIRSTTSLAIKIPVSLDSPVQSLGVNGRSDYIKKKITVNSKNNANHLFYANAIFKLSAYLKSLLFLF